MSFQPKQFRELIVRPALKNCNLWSPEAEELLMLTCATESHLGRYLKQWPTGPALGIYQMEEATFNWLRDKYNIKRFASEMIWDLHFATEMARLRYLVDPQPIPKAINIQKLAEYWKRIYNTESGAGSVQQAMADYHDFVERG